ncbi:MAG TPA: hypothetical protein VHQ47_08145 [Phycisphaerae bacterium]|jgi:hypothetical protein|nr:hypothetical protein [Phycisphaerae bacterium]
MSSTSLLSRAKAMLQRRAAGTALVIVPLALAAPAAADSLFVLGNNSVSGPLSGGAVPPDPFGHADSSLISAGSGVELSGDTIPVDTPGTPLTAAWAAKASVSAAGPATIVFEWSGGFASGSTLDTTDSVLLFDAISPKTMPDDSGTVAWTIFAGINDPDGSALVQQAISSSDAGDTFLLPVINAGTADSWDIQLAMQWTFPMTESGGVINADSSVAAAQLDAAPLIDLSIISQAGSSIPPEPAPLPAAFWPGASLLTLLAAGAFLRNRRPRTAP